MRQSSLQTSLPDSKSDALLTILRTLPTLPNVVRYYDDFDEKTRSIEDYSSLDFCEIVINGVKVNIDFSRFGEFYDQLAKHLFFYFITEDLRVSTAYNYLISLLHVDRDMLVEILSAGPLGIKPVWAKLFTNQQLTHMSYAALKVFLGFLAKRNLYGWTPTYLEFIASTLPTPSRDKYAGVRTGDVFLSVEEEASIVNYLDDLVATSTQDAEKLDDQTLRRGCMLMCSYLFGMRPIQIASLTMRDVRIWNEASIENPSVHLTFKMVKQRTQSKAFPLLRRVKHDWAYLIELLNQRAIKKGLSGGDRLFEVTSASEVGLAIIDLASIITGVDVTATDLRHTAAQRLVDAGASQEEVAEFLGHSDVTTCLVYYQTSANQAERVNKALGISDIYLRVVKIAHDKFISHEELAELKDIQQIAGVPHGIPIAGIGGCATGQPSCPYNPITSCYGCRKFMPVADVELHKRVLGDMRGVVTFFVDASLGDSHSPAYMQLRRAISSIQQVIAELEEPANA